jgi:putative heme transporter
MCTPHQAVERNTLSRCWSSQKLRRWSYPIGFVVVVLALGVAGVRLRELLSSAFAQLGSLTLPALALVAACWFTMLVSRGIVYRLTHPHLRFHHGIVLDQVNLAAANGLPGGSVVGIAARIRICRSLGHGSEQAALTVFASGQAFAIGRWVCLLIIIGASMILRGTNTIDLLQIGSALIALLLSCIIWMVLSSDSRASQALLHFIENTITRTSRTQGAFRRARFRASVHRFRSGANELVRDRAPKLIGAGALSTLFGALILVVVINDLSPSAISALDILRAYLIARVATSFIPTPGGVGVLDGAITAGLMSAGVEPSVAISAVIVYRAVTFALPIATGSLIYLVWRRKSNHHNEVEPDDVEPDDDGATDSLLHAA